MKKVFYIFLGIVLLLISGGFDRALATDVSGVITGDTTWNTAGSPYVLKGDVTVELVEKVILSYNSAIATQ